MAERQRTPGFPQEMSRRDLLDWIGRGAVLYLSADVLAACGVSPSDGSDLVLGRDASDPDPDLYFRDLTGTPDLEALSDQGELGDISDAGEAAVFDFEPGEAGDEVFPPWSERTVDHQELVDILAAWRLTVGGMVANPIELTFGDLVALPRQNQITDFHCVEGWTVQDVPWNGVHIQKLLDLVQPTSDATHITFHTIGGTYNESLPLEVALEPRTLLAYGVAGETLPLSRGFPLRLVVPRLFGYKSAKFVERIELTNEPVNGFWENAGYTYEAEVPPSRLRDGKY